MLGNDNKLYIVIIFLVVNILLSVGCRSLVEHQEEGYWC